jgi:hypothetical protein
MIPIVSRCLTFAPVDYNVERQDTPARPPGGSMALPLDVRSTFVHTGRNENPVWAAVKKGTSKWQSCL